MFLNSITISSKGQITLPKKARDILMTKFLNIEISDDNKIILSPVKDVAGSLSQYTIENKNLSFKDIRQQTWQDNLSSKKI